MSEETQTKKSGGAIKYLFWLIVLVLLFALIGFLGFAFWTGKGIKDASLTAKQTVLEMFNVYRPQKVTEKFFEFRDLEVKGNDGNILEVATGEQSVMLAREDSVQILGKIIPGVKTTSRINVPATFRYHIDLNAKWELVKDDNNRLHVTAPELKPSLPVAFDSSKMQKDNPGWMKYISGDSMAELEKTITPELETKAKEEAHIKEFQAEAKKSISKFLHTWLVRDGFWQEGEVEEIIVYFAGEKVDIDDKLLTPDMSLDKPVF